MKRYLFVVHMLRAPAYEQLFDYKLQPGRVRFTTEATHNITEEPYTYAYDSLSEPERATIYASVMEQLAEGFYVESSGAEYVRIYSQVDTPNGVLNVLAGAIIQTDDADATLLELGLEPVEDLP